MRASTALARWTARLTRGRGTLPLRWWLVLAVVAITGAGFLAQMSLVAPVNAWQQQAEGARLASARKIIGTDVEQWRDPAWQRRADASFATLGIDVALFPVQAGSAAPSEQAAYMTPGARRFLDASAQDTASSQAAAGTQLIFQRVVIADPAQPASHTSLGVALVWDATPTPGGLFGLLWTVVEWGTFMLALAIVLWLIGQPVLRPLAAMSQAAEDIAGGDLNVHLPASPVREIAEVGSALEGMSVSLRDALARQDALEQERRMLVGAIAHDLRTPLFMLRGHLKGLERGVASTPEKIAHYVAVCQTQANVLERLVSDLFAYIRLEHLELEPQRESLDLGALLHRNVEAASPLAAAKAITLMADTPNGACAMVGDGHLLTRAVENLLDNAIRHTPEGGEIRVRLARKQDRLVFTVEDSGPGIATQDLPHLFTPLYRGDTSRNRQTGGAGLGLAIARRILEAHSGTLAAANGPSGAIFTGTVPAAPRLAEAPSTLTTAFTHDERG